MKFTTKLYASIGFILLLISISVVILMNMLEQSIIKMNVVVNELYERIDIASEIKYETANIGRAFREATATPENGNNREALNAWEESNLKIKQGIESLKELDTQEKSLDLMEQYTTLHDSYQDMVQQVIVWRKVDIEVGSQAAMVDEIKLTRERMLQTSQLLLGLQEQEMKNELLRSRDTYNWAVTSIYVYLAISLSLGIGLIIWIIRSMTKNLNKVTTVMNSVSNSNGDDLPRIEIVSKDEIGSIAAAFNTMVSELEAHSKLEKHLLEEAEEHGWLKTKIAEIATMYPEAKDIQMLGESFISKLVPIVDASFGVFYLKSENGAQPYLKRIAAYAFSNQFKASEGFYIGEGLVGQCALEKQPILLTQVPEDYISIRSGTGEGSPRNIIILPVQLEGEVLGVIEIASFHAFTSSQVKLLEEINSTLGMAINSMLNHMRAERLLQESQALTEELQVQSEELQLQQEELRTTNEKLEEQYTASEQKKKELEKVREALEEKAQQLEISSQYKSEFLANMSHELRTPLNSLLILARILSENEEGNLSKKQEEYTRTIYTSGNDLLLLINDILDLAKIESGKLEVISKEVNLYDVQDYLSKQFSPIASQKDIQFNVQLEPNVSNYLYTDEQCLKQILKNLLSNAFKFTESGSVLLQVRKVRTEYIEKQMPVSTQAEYMLAFSVIDTGIGVPREKQRVIFDAFKQADGTTSRKYGGTGLGLSISREMASVLGGFIELTSEVRKGSNFTLYLPILQSSEILEANSYIEEAAAGLEYEDYSLNEKIEVDEEGGSINEEGKSSLKHKKVLIVDDDIRNVYALTIALEKYEMDIIVAENGREGIEMLQDNPDTDIVLMDIMMPEMDGFEAMRRIRQLPKYQTLPIIALTAKAMKQSREECLAAGATDYISKPIDVDQLFSLMHVWLYRKEG
ncbi:response regulator [Peribacillus asahii]|uniref:response regulator n=1 Tax=Peribacillus asahii TaxID=228899 RepID=UPI0038235D0D